MGFLILLMFAAGSKPGLIVDLRMTVENSLNSTIRVLLLIDDWRITGHLCHSPHDRFRFTIDFRLLVYETQLWILDFGLMIVAWVAGCLSVPNRIWERSGSPIIKPLLASLLPFITHIRSLPQTIDNVIACGLTWAIVALVGLHLRAM